jgi:hypothetical protein
MEEGDFDPSDFNKTISNDDYTITIKGKKVKEFGETTTFEGDGKGFSKEFERNVARKKDRFCRIYIVFFIL